MWLLASLLMIPGVALLLLAVGLLGALNNAYPFQTMWVWFVVPVFGVPALTFGQALGLLLVLSFIRGIRASDSKRTTEDKVADIVGQVLIPWVMLAVAWCVRLIWF